MTLLDLDLLLLRHIDSLDFLFQCVDSVSLDSDDILPLPLLFV